MSAAVPLPPSSCWTAVVLRAPDAGWDGARATGARPEAVHDAAAGDVDAPYRIVQHAGFVAVAAPSAEVARHVAARLRVEWRPADALQAPAQEAAAELEHAYRWPLSAPAPAVLPHAVAHWNQARLRVWAEHVDAARLQRELAALLALPAADVEVHAGQAGPADTAAHDAAVDAGLLAHRLHVPVRVQAQGRACATPLTLRYRAWRDTQDALARWACGASLPLAPRPAAAVLQAGLAPATPETATPVYDLPADILPPDRPLPLDTRLPDGEVAHAQAFARESFVDELAAAQGQDPVQWRLQHLSDPTGHALVEAVARQAGWQPRVQPSRQGRGRGFAYASMPDTASQPARQAWAAWVVDVAVDSDSGHVRIERLTVGHHAAGAPALADDPRWQRQITAAARQLLAPAPAHDDWGPPATAPDAAAASMGALQWVDLPVAQVAEPGALSESPALTLPAAAAMANAIYDATGIRLREPRFDGLGRQAQAALRGPAARRPLARAWAWAGASAAALVGLGAALLPWRAELPLATPDPSLYSAAAIERGRLIAAASDCVVCHTAPGGTPNAGGLGLETPFGTVYSTNITPDPETGIGRWSFEAFDRAMRHGISRDGRHLYPAFPYTSFAKFSDGDMQALYAFLMTQPAVPARPPETRLAFPYNLRGMMAGWNLLFHDAAPFQPDPARSTLWNRGAYLVEGAGHCGACHTPRNALGAERGGLQRYLAGAQVDHWDAPALNALSSAPLPWTQQDLYDYLRTGFSARHGAATGPMAPVVAGLQALPDHDILAMATYLSDLPGAPAPAAATPAPAATPAAAPDGAARVLAMAGRGIYEGACAACHDPAHGARLFGVRPDLALNSNIAAPRPDNLIQVILHGIASPADSALGYMPGFADSLDDAQIADLAAYLRARYAADAPPWQNLPETVRRLRALQPVAEHAP